MLPPVDTLPRAKNAAVTRQAMLAAARRRFLQESYENVGLRDVASDAGVDVALVSRYFGNKEDLFKEVLLEGSSNDPGTAAELPARLTAIALEQNGEDDAGHLERLLIVLRSASSPKAAELVRATLRDDILAPMAELLEGDDPDVRASLALALLMGTAILRTVMSVQPICEAAGECSVDRRLLTLFEAALANKE